MADEVSRAAGYIWALFTLASGEVILSRPGDPLVWFDGEKEIPLTPAELLEVIDQILPPGYGLNGRPRIPGPADDPRPD